MKPQAPEPPKATQTPPQEPVKPKVAEPVKPVDTPASAKQTTTTPPSQEKEKEAPKPTPTAQEPQAKSSTTVPQKQPDSKPSTPESPQKDHLEKNKVVLGSAEPKESSHPEVPKTPITNYLVSTFSRLLPKQRISVYDYFDIQKLVKVCEEKGYEMSAYSGTALLSVTSVVLFVVLGIVKVVINLKGAVLNGLLAFGSGALLSDVFLHIWPEVSPTLEAKLTIISGIFLFFLLDKALGNRAHPHPAPISESEAVKDLIIEEEKEEKGKGKGKGRVQPSKTKAKSAAKPAKKDKEVPVAPAVSQSSEVVSLHLLADSLHNFLDGIAIALAFQHKALVGISTTLAILLHEFPHKIGDFAVLLNAGKGLVAALWLQIVTGGVGLLGTYVVVSGASRTEIDRYAVPLITGNFLYLALTSMMGGLKETMSWRSLFCEVWGFLAGVGLMLALALAE